MQRPRHGQRAAKSLGWIGEPEGIPVLRKALNEPNPAIRREAAGALWQMGKTNRRTVDRVAPVLIQALKQEDNWVRYEACERLGEFGGNDALGALAALKQDPDDTVRGAAEMAIGSIKRRRG